MGRAGTDQKSQQAGDEEKSEAKCAIARTEIARTEIARTEIARTESGRAVKNVRTPKTQRRKMKLFVSPHNDDAALFGAFTLQREDPRVLTVFDSYVQFSRGHGDCGVVSRRAEDTLAMKALGCVVEFAAVRDNEEPAQTFKKVSNALSMARSFYRPAEVWLPVVEGGGHAQHNIVGELGVHVFADAKIHRYLTYTSAGKSTNGTKVPFTGVMLRKKLQALACYKTQIEIDALGCAEHFIRDQNEYVL